MKNKNVKNVKIHKKHKFILLKILLSLVAIFLVVYIIYVAATTIIKRNILSKNVDVINLNEEIIEYGSTLSYNDIYSKLINSNNLYKGSTVNIYLDNSLITTNSSISFNEVKDINLEIEIITPVIPFLENNVVVLKEVKWKVKDNKYPVINGIQNREITAGDEFDSKTGIAAIDEVDGSLDVTIEGEYDINVPGKYTITVKAVDKNNNVSTESYELTVNEKKVAPTTSSQTSSSTNKSSSSSSSNSKSSSSSSSNKSNNSSGSTTSSTPQGNSSSSALTADTKEGRLNLAKQEAKRVVSKIITSGMTKLEKATAICNYITNTVSVQENQSNEAYQSNYGNEAYAALILKIAACSGRCKAVTLLCDAAGLKSQHINAGEWTHQWNKVQIDDGSWVVVDSQIGLVADKHPLE